MIRRFRALLTRWRQRGLVGVGAADDMADDRSRVLGLNPTRIPSGKQWQLLPSFLSATEKTWLRIFITTGIISGLALVVLLGSHHIVSAPQTGGTSTIGLVGTPQFINPVLARENTADADLSRLLFRGIVKINANFQPVPDLAESVTVSDDRKTYTIKLRDHLVWSDGEPLTANDIKFTLDTIKDPEFGSPLRSLFQSATTTVVDDRTATVSIDKPLAAFPFYFDVGLLPQHAWSDATPQTMPLAELNVKPISSGPYKFLSVTKDRSGSIKSLTFVRNKSYYGPEPYLNRINIKFYPDSTSAVEALQKDSVDILGGLTPDENKDTKKEFVRSSFAISQLTAVFFNERDSAILKVKEVRQALNMSVDRAQLINDFLPGQASPIANPVLPGYPGSRTDQVIPTPDLAAANAVLENAGWKKNDQGVRQKGTTKLAFTLTAPNDPVYVGVANRLITTWRSLGISVDINALDPSQIQRDAVRPRKYDALLFGEIYDADGDLYPFWHSSQQRDPGFNLSLYYNKKVDGDLADARDATTLAQRATDYQDFQTVLADELPAIFLFQQRYVQAHRSQLRGLETNRLVSPTDRFSDIGLWYVKTRLTWK